MNNKITYCKEGDYLIGKYELNTFDTLLLFTTLGNYLYVPVHELPICVWKDMGKHISNIIKLDSDEKIVSAIPVWAFPMVHLIGLPERITVLRGQAGIFRLTVEHPVRFKH